MSFVLLFLLLKGPFETDHSLGTAQGWYMSVNIPDWRNRSDTAILQSLVNKWSGRSASSSTASFTPSPGSTSRCPPRKQDGTVFRSFIQPPRGTCGKSFISLLAQMTLTRSCSRTRTYRHSLLWMTFISQTALVKRALTLISYVPSLTVICAVTH